MQNYEELIPLSEEVGKEKHRDKGETFEDAMDRLAVSMTDSDEHYLAFKDILLNRRFLPAGRIQSSMGSVKNVTAFNCFVAPVIEDSMEGIFDVLRTAALTMQKGGGIGYDFSTIRPCGDYVKGPDSFASGPLSFMRVFDTMCGTIMSAGSRRGAMMAMLRCDHPDIYEYVTAKAGTGEFKNFNMSVACTEEFMEAVKGDLEFDLKFNGKVYRTVQARELWELIMSTTWDWAEPGVIYVDRINQMNNLGYCETITTTNPCGEQPLPPDGACLLGSFNWAAYLVEDMIGYTIDTEQLLRDIPHVVRAMDLVIDRTKFPTEEQEQEAKDKRRMGLGATGVANAVEAMGHPYASKEFLGVCDTLQRFITQNVYQASIYLAKEKGAFPLFEVEGFLSSGFMQAQPESIVDQIKEHGIRNALLVSMAPTGSISVAANNISSGIEPVFAEEYERKVLQADGTHKKELVQDYGKAFLGVIPKTADQLTPEEHVSVLSVFQKHVDSACSKTCNIGDDVTFEEFKAVYILAYDEGAKGCTTFRAAGKLMGILSAVEKEPEEAELVEGAACFIDPSTGKKTCD